MRPPTIGLTSLECRTAMRPFTARTRVTGAKFMTSTASGTGLPDQPGSNSAAATIAETARPRAKVGSKSRFVGPPVGTSGLAFIATESQTSTYQDHRPNRPSDWRYWFPTSAGSEIRVWSGSKSRRGIGESISWVTVLALTRVIKAGHRVFHHGRTDMALRRQGLHFSDIRVATSACLKVAASVKQARSRIRTSGPLVHLGQALAAVAGSGRHGSFRPARQPRLR